MDLAVLVEGLDNPKTIKCDKLKDGPQWSPIMANLKTGFTERYDQSATVEWLGNKKPEPVNRDAKTLAWQNDLTGVLDWNTGSEAEAKTAKELRELMESPPDVKTITGYLAAARQDQFSPVRGTQKKSKDARGRDNKTAWHYWIDRTK
jgi:hypothetical protein